MVREQLFRKYVFRGQLLRTQICWRIPKKGMPRQQMRMWNAFQMSCGFIMTISLLGTWNIWWTCSLRFIAPNAVFLYETPKKLGVCLDHLAALGIQDFLGRRSVFLRLEGLCVQLCEWRFLRYAMSSSMCSLCGGTCCLCWCWSARKQQVPDDDLIVVRLSLECCPGHWIVAKILGNFLAGAVCRLEDVLGITRAEWMPIIFCGKGNNWQSGR